MTPEDANRLHKETWDRLIKKYGSRFAVPEKEVAFASELLRANHAVSDTSMSTAECLRHYSVTPEVAATFNVDVTIMPVKKVSKYKVIEDWLAANVGGQVTAQELAEIGGVSLSTASNYIKDKVLVFIKVKRGLYEIRDPAAERARALAS